MSSITAMDETTIELSKTKLVVLLLGASAFVALGYWMLSLDSAIIEAQPRFNNPLLFHGLGGVLMALSGTFGGLALRKLFDNKPGLVFNQLGILDNSSTFSAGLVPWEEISGFGVYETHKQKMLVVFVVDPSKYIEVGGSLRRYLIRASSHMSGSPIVITPSALKTDFDELHRLFGTYFSKYAKRA